MRKVFVGCLLLVALVVTASLWRRNEKSGQSEKVAAEAKYSADIQLTAHTHEAMAEVPAYYSSAPNLSALLPTLSLELFTGNKRLAYQAAQEIPQTLAQLPCYCHCDKSKGHRSLHSCFESEHGADCGICIGEALMAYQLEKRGRLSVAEVRRRIVAAYGTATKE